jgi:hypothetical protein
LLYNSSMSLTDQRVFKPEIQTRKNEYLAWAVAIISCASSFFLTSGAFSFWIVFFAVLMVFMALAVSLSNWMDRRTHIILDDDGVIFQNGLRNLRLDWNEIKSISIFSTGWGQRVLVEGKEAHFTFTILGEVRTFGKVQGRIGFAQGKEIMDAIIKQSGLTSMSASGDAYYYSRK